MLHLDLNLDLNGLHFFSPNFLSVSTILVMPQILCLKKGGGGCDSYLQKLLRADKKKKKGLKLLGKSLSPKTMWHYYKLALTKLLFGNEKCMHMN